MTLQSVNVCELHEETCLTGSVTSLEKRKLKNAYRQSSYVLQHKKHFRINTLHEKYLYFTKYEAEYI
jgi:hypothetical protein